MDPNKYNREKIIDDLAGKSQQQKIEILRKLKIDFLESTDHIYRLRDALNESSKTGILGWITFDRWCDNKIKDQIEIDHQQNQLYINTTKQKKKTSYKWQNNPDVELPELYELITNKFNLIALETTYEQFEAVFIEQPIESINPIKWHQDNASELLYFIGKLEQSDNIFHNPKKADYQRLAACFVKPDGNPFTPNWKQINQNISINLSQEKQKAIDELLKNF